MKCERPEDWQRLAGRVCEPRFQDINRRRFLAGRNITLRVVRQDAGDGCLGPAC